MRHLRGILLALGLLGGGAAQGSNGAGALEVLRDAGCQTSLPADSGGAGASTAGAERAPSRYRARPSRVERDPLRAPVRGFAIAPALLWVGAGVAALLLIAAVARGLVGRAGAPRVRPPARVDAAGTRAAGGAVQEVPDHERLAGAGDFTAAVHALLGQAIVAWLRHGGEAPPHATARELLRRARRGGAATEPLAHLVQVVELAHFGGRPADRTLYDTSRDHLRAWEAACQPTK